MKNTNNTNDATARRNLRIGLAFIAILAVLGACQSVLDNQTSDTAAGAQAGARAIAPVFEVDQLWPKPLPNHWLLGMTIGVWVDDQDNVWIIHRGGATLHAKEKGQESGLSPECCRSAPPVLVFDPQGNLVRSWGGPGQGYDWP